MKNTHKIANMVLTFTLTGMLLYAGVAHCAPRASALRSPSIFWRPMSNNLKKPTKVLSPDKVEKILLKTIFTLQPEIKRGKVRAGGKAYKYSYPIGTQRGFYRAGDIFVVNSEWRSLIPEEVKNTTKLIYLDFNSDFAGLPYKRYTILTLIGLQALDLKGKTIVDAGSGSGIISLASTLLGAKKVYVLDSDISCKDFIRDTEKINNIPTDGKLDFSYFNRTFKELAKAQIGKKVDMVFMNVMSWGILEGELPDVLSVFPCRTIILSGGLYGTFAKKCNDMSKYPYVNPEMNSKVKKFIVENFFEPMNLELVETLEHKDVYGTCAGFILNIAGIKERQLTSDARTLQNKLNCAIRQTDV